MIGSLTCALLAPALAAAAVQSWALPEATLVVPEADRWTPAPTLAPDNDFLELFRRDDDNTCGYVSGIPSSSLVCNDANYICATNTFYGVHGCCNPASMSSCTIPVTCVPSNSIAVSCTGGCSSDNFGLTCTDPASPSCYEWHYVYTTPTSTVLTEFGCATSAFTKTVLRDYTDEPTSSSIRGSDAAISNTQGSGIATGTKETTGTATSSTATATSTAAAAKKTPWAVIGGAVGGGLVLIAAITGSLIYCLMYRKPKPKPPTNLDVSTQYPTTQMSQYPTHPANEPYMEPQENKPWRPGVHTPTMAPMTSVPLRAPPSQEYKPPVYGHGKIQDDGFARPYEGPGSPQHRDNPGYANRYDGGAGAGVGRMPAGPNAVEMPGNGTGSVGRMYEAP